MDFIIALTVVGFLFWRSGYKNGLEEAERRRKRKEKYGKE